MHCSIKFPLTMLALLLNLGAENLAAAAKSSVPLITKAEHTGWLETGRYDEVERLCAAFAKAYPSNVRCFTFGQTPEGRPMLAMAVGESRFLSPSSKNAHERPVVLFQGGIHAGEIDGKDAGFWLLRDILNGKVLPEVLKKVTLVFVPVFNADGHERFGAFGRPNQVGPKEMGWRVTAQNFNLNRDYLKVDAPETRAMIRLLRAWDPMLYVDLHVTDGAKFQHDIAVMIEPSLPGPEALRTAAARLSDKTMSDLKQAGNLPLSFYPSFNIDDEPKSGINVGPPSVRFSNGYWSLRNRIGVLVETHSWRPYDHRVKSTYETVKSLIASAAVSGREWIKAAEAADAESETLIGKTLALNYKNTPKSKPIEFLGYAYTRKKSQISGQFMTRYDPSKPEVWELPLFYEVEPKISAVVPRAFIIPAAYKDLYEERFKLHGITYDVLKTPWQGKADTYRTKLTGAFKEPYESHQRPEYDGAWETTTGEAPAGSLKVNMDQVQGKLAMLLLEPSSPESLLAWGYMNQIFERKEYMEAYVAEEVGEGMLKDPVVKAEFQEKLKDPEFAKSPEKRLDFFAQKHQSFDQRYLVYPVLRVN